MFILTENRIDSLAFVEYNFNILCYYINNVYSMLQVKVALQVRFQFLFG
jgi:hypothetical protein